jgi:hypothetical protein
MSPLTLDECENQGVPDKIFNGTGLTKFSQICHWLKVTFSSKVPCLKDWAMESKKEGRKSGQGKCGGKIQLMI